MSSSGGQSGNGAAGAAAAQTSLEERQRLRALAEARLRDRDERLRARAAREAAALERARRQETQQILRAERDAREAERAALRARVDAREAERAALRARVAPRWPEPRTGRSLLIHIGLRKAGSASIQSFLAANAAPLRAAGFDYPAAGREHGRKAHHAIAHDLRAQTKADAPSGALEALRRHWRESESANLILSSEMFEGLKRRECQSLAELLTDGDEDVKILMVIRDLVDLTPSSYAQKIRYGHNVFDFDEFFADRITHPRVDYHRTARAWADAFGWRALRVRVLDRRLLKNGDLIEEFLAVAGAPSELAFERPGHVNAAPGWRVLEAMRALYGGRHGLPPAHPLASADRHSRETRKRVGVAAEALGETLGWNKDRGRYMTAEQAERCLEEYRAAVATFNEQLAVKIPEPLGLEARGFVARGAAPDVSQIGAGELRAFYDSLFESLPKKLKGPGAGPGQRPPADREPRPLATSPSPAATL